MSDINEAKRLLLADYERERDELNAVIARLRRDLRIESGTTVNQPESTIVQPANGGQQKVEDAVKPGDFYKMPQIGAAREFLERRGERNTASLQEIGQALLRGKAIETALDEKGLRNLSSMMSKHDDFKSIAKGRWGLAKWYGGKGKKKKQVPDADPAKESEETQAK